MSLDPGYGYRAFLDAARDIEELVRSRPEASERDVAEGYSYLAGMWQLHLERALKGDDVDRPCFVRDMDSVRNWGLPTPDHHYYSAQIDGRGTYRIQGHRGSVSDYCFEILTGLVGDDGIAGRRIAALEASRMQFEADGRFELWVGGEPRDGNWLPSDAEARTIFVRQTVGDWRTESPTPMLIERVDTFADRRPPPSADDIQLRLQRAARRLVDQVRFLDRFSRHWAQTLPLNELPPPAVGPADAGYFPGQYNTKCRFEFQPGEALLLTMPPCAARYQSVSLGHPLWFNSIDPRNVQSTLNHLQSRSSEDGQLRFVICDRDPGFLNWLDTGGQTRGFVFVRYQQVQGGAPPAPAVRRMPVPELSSAMPPREPTCDPAGRSEAARLRRLGLDRRFF